MGQEPTTPQESTGDAETGKDGLVHCRWFTDPDLDGLTGRVNKWAEELGTRLKICGMSHSVQIIVVGDKTFQINTAVVLWRLRKKKKKKKKSNLE